MTTQKNQATSTGMARAVVALQAQPAAVSDDQLQAIDDEHNWQTFAGRMAAYRAILALRPQAVPMTPDVLELRAAAKSVSLMSVLVDGRECAVPFDQIKRLDAAIKAIDGSITAPAGGEQPAAHQATKEPHSGQKD